MSLTPWKTARRRTSLVIVARQLNRWSVYTRMVTTDRTSSSPRSRTRIRRFFAAPGHLPAPPGAAAERMEPCTASTDSPDSAPTGSWVRFSKLPWRLSRSTGARCQRGRPHRPPDQLVPPLVLPGAPDAALSSTPRRSGAAGLFCLKVPLLADGSPQIGTLRLREELLFAGHWCLRFHDVPGTLNSQESRRLPARLR